MTEALPSFSIVVPTYARPRRLAACLEALSGLDYPKDRFEVVVVDDGGDLSLDDAVAPARQRIDLTLHRQSNAGPATARNTGAQIAQGEYLAFTDDDCAPAPAWLSHLAARLAETPAAMVGGRTVNALPDNPFSEASQSLMSYLYLYYEASPRPTGFLASNNLALPAGAFRELGGFDVRYPRAAGEDRDLCDRWCAAGGEIVYAPQALVSHRHALGLRTFWRQHYNYGRGAYQFRRGAAGPGDDNPRRRFEPFSFYFGLLRHPFRGESVRRAAPMAGLFVVSQIATVAGFATEGLTGGAACARSLR